MPAHKRLSFLPCAHREGNSVSETPNALAAHQKLQLLGLAFAGADLLFEVNRSGVITFALGAVERLTGRGAADLVGTRWTDIVEAEDAHLLEVLLAGIKAGERQRPLRVALRSRPGTRLRRHGSLSVFRLPQADAMVSCAISLGAPSALDEIPRRRDGLIETESFTATAGALFEQAESAGLPVRLDLVEMNGLGAAISGMDKAAGDQVRQRVAATLRCESYAGAGASEVAPDKFALVRLASASEEGQNGKLQDVAGPGVTPVSAQIPLDAEPPARNLRAMRYALDRYIEEGPTEAASSFKATVQRALRDSTRFKTMLAAGEFHLAYQPVVTLEGTRLSHFEALARFDANSSPADTIRLAEELDLIADFDLAVTAVVAKALAAHPKVKIAVNLSAVSLMQQGFIEALTAITAYNRTARPRMLFEITETSQLTDLPKANQILSALRRLGHTICLDDFGSGAASVDYLRTLEIDIVKIDGSYIQDLESDARGAVVLKHMVALCRELKIVTLAEKVESAASARRVADLGVTLAQGWHYGKPTALPEWSSPPPAAPIVARRQGAVESWG